MPKKAVVPEPKALSAEGTRALFEKELSGELYDPVVSEQEAARLPEEPPEIGSLREQKMLRDALYPES